MTSDIVLQAEDLCKCFKIYSNPWDRAREWASFGRRRFHRPFQALKNISFEVRRGEFFGVIGQNGAGKSTLLKVLTGILDPTKGWYRTNGRVLSLLELGTDFNGHLSARQNIVRSTELLGFPQGYVQERMVQIEEFSELAEFFDRPVRLYSSGMRSRLAFSMFAFLECDLLILDEVLAVGDIFFKQKCFARLEKLIAEKTSIILVTHGMSVVRQFCDKVLLLDKGREIYQGKPDEAIFTYQQIKGRKKAALVMSMPEEDAPVCGAPAADQDEAEESFWPSEEVFAPVDFSEKGQKARVARFAICNDKCEPCMTFKQGEQVFFYCEFQPMQMIGPPVMGVRITNRFNQVVHAKNVLHHGTVLPSCVRQGDYVRLFQKVTLNLAPQQYVVDVFLKTMRLEDYENLDEMDHKEFSEKNDFVCVFRQACSFRVIHEKGRLKAHGGICDLPGGCRIQVVSSESMAEKAKTTA